MNTSFITETSPGLIQGVLDLLSLSLSCERASWQVYQTFKPTASFVEDIRASERDQFLGSIVDTLACDLRPAPDAARHPSQAREERSMHLVQHGSVFTHSPSLWNPYTIQFSMYYPSLLIGAQKTGNPCTFSFILALKDGAF
jgi:hypothetical protein